MGNLADMPKPREWDDSDRWHIGKPDLIVTSPPHKVPAEAADWWGSYYVDTGLTEDRYIKAIESKPGKTAVVHHLLTYAVDADASGDSNGDDSSGDAGEFLNEFAVGKNGDLFPEGTGRLLRAGSKIKFDFHYHSVGQEITDQSQLGIVLYPKGYAPKHIVYSKQLGQPTEPLDIPGGSTYVRSDGYTRFNKAGRITAFQPHMHTRGKRQCIELIYPDNKTEQISCADWSFNWHLVSVYADDVAPIYPAGTVLHVITLARQLAVQGQSRSAQLGRQRQPDDRRDGLRLDHLVRLHRRRVQGGARSAQGREEDHDHALGTARNDIAECGLRIADCGLIADCGTRTARLAAVALPAAVARARRRAARRAVAVHRAAHQVQVRARASFPSTKDGNASRTAASTWCSAT